MKKSISIALAAMMLIGALGLTATAQEASSLSTEVYVTIADQGSLAVTQEKITVTDADGDHALTLNDALFCAHEEKYPGGASAGYASAVSEYGLGLTKLWGDESGSYGYYINNASAWSLADPITDGDYVYAFVYADGTGWSDAYSYFDENTVAVQAGEELTLTLSRLGYDASWNTVVLPVEGATITVNGASTKYKTDAQGKVTVVFEQAGEVVISALGEGITLVPAVAVVSVTQSAPSTGDDTVLSLVLVALSVGALGLMTASKKRYEI